MDTITPPVTGPTTSSTTTLKKVLIAEDDQFISKAYMQGFKRQGFEVILAMDGNEALLKAKTEKPDIILLDLIMPIKNGFEVLKELKEMPDFKYTPIIILSNLGQEADVEKGKNMGATEYLVKTNSSMHDVIDKVNQYLQK
jgi:DNA-binding response OmpR family regulator